MFPKHIHLPLNNGAFKYTLNRAKGAILNLDIQCPCSAVPKHFIYLPLLMSGHLGSLSVCSWWGAVSAWLEFSASSLCVTCGSRPPGPTLELLTRLCWTDLTATRSSGTVWEVSVTESPTCRPFRYRAWLEGMSEDVSINHKSSVTTSSRAGLAEDNHESDMQSELLHALCTWEALVSMVACFPFWLLQLIIK